MNKPTNGPCWVVYVWIEGRMLWLRGPEYVESVEHESMLVKHRGPLFNNAFRFTTRGVEPFTVEEDAIRAALMIDGGIKRYESWEDEGT